MKLACASSVFARAIERGELTQLEFIERCARELAVDGIVLDVRDFPRTDADYLAQVKKMATDLGLGIAAVSDADFFTGNENRTQEMLHIALAIGAPLLSAPLAAETTFSWPEQLARLNAATGLAKAANVTLALRNAPGTFASSIYELKKAAKEADSAWLRFGPEPALFDAADNTNEIAAKVVLLWANDAHGETAKRFFPHYRGYTVLALPVGPSTART